MYIIVKGNNSKGSGRGSADYQGFHPHWNHSMAKEPVWIGSRKQYDRELKSRGLIRYDPDFQDSPKRESYKGKKETRHIVTAIKQQSDKNGFNPSGTLKHELINRKVILKRSEYERKLKMVPKEARGGFSATD